MCRMYSTKMCRIIAIAIRPSGHTAAAAIARIHNAPDTTCPPQASSVRCRHGGGPSLVYWSIARDSPPRRRMGNLRPSATRPSYGGGAQRPRALRALAWMEMQV